MKDIEQKASEHSLRLNSTAVDHLQQARSAGGRAAMLPLNKWQQATAHALEDILYPGLSAVLQRQQELETELKQLQADWLNTFEHLNPQSDAQELVCLQGLQVAEAAQELICRLDRLEVEIMAFKSRRRGELAFSKVPAKTPLYRLAS